MIARAVSKKAAQLARQFPVVSITGPRQSGKTTLCRMVFQKHAYASLEDPNTQEFALADPKGFLLQFSTGVILDEVQRAPELLSYIQGIVDREDKPGHFILTGSQQLHLMSKISQTLAGRTAILNLLPFCLNELMGRAAPDPWRLHKLPTKTASPRFSLETILHTGLYPRIHDKKLAAQDWLSAYYRTYVERDVRDAANIGNLEAFQRFVRLCAGRTGQILNLSSLGADCGISHTTARQWLSILQAGFIVHLLQPHHVNFSKRLIKSPKLYFIDTGLLCYLLRVRTPGDLVVHAMRGAIFETFVIVELYKAFANRGEVPPLYFWRDRTGHEVDVLIDAGSELIPVEVKSGQTISGSSLDGLKYFMALGSPSARRGVLIHGGSELYEREGCIVRPWYMSA